MIDVEDPTLDQTPETIAAYLVTCVPGSEVAIENRQCHVLHLVITTIRDVHPARGRLYTDAASYGGGHSWYRTTGKNTFHPKGQSRLVEPTEAVREFARLYPQGTSAGNPALERELAERRGFPKRGL